jgi:RHH-type transcriptional regulator, rel operon repressor / antitoxin RelB
MAANPLPDDIRSTLQKLSSKTGRAEESILREALVRFMEDMEDARLAEEVIRNPGRIYTLEEVVRELGLDD